MSHSAQELLDTIIGRLKTLANTETVVGDPVEVGEVTILPVIKVSVGFAAGGGEGSGGTEKAGKGLGGGGGGGASVSPVGFIVWDGKTVRFIGIGKGKIEALVETVPDLLKKLGITGREKGGGKGRRGESAAADDG